MTGVAQLVDGKITDPSEHLAATLTDPNTGAVLHDQLGSSFDDIETAIAAAERIHTSSQWSDLPGAQKANAIRRLQAELAARADGLAAADSLDTGVSPFITGALIGARIGLLEVVCSQIESEFAHTEHTTSIGPVDQWRLPWGPAAIFIPWNAPASTAIMKTGDALAAGCPVIIKPSEWAPHFSASFAEAVEAAGLPEGLVQIVHGDRTVGERIVNDRRIAAVSYTGGVAGGTAVAEACARQLKPVDLELSGNNPVVALPTADPSLVAAQVAMGMLFLNGQICIGPRRLVVPASQVDAYVAALAGALETVKIGPSDDPTTTLGPLCHAGHVSRIEAQIAELESLGCVVRRFGRRPDGAGHFLQPAVVLADKGAQLREEIFGPVVLVRTYDDVDEAVRIANDHPYGLSAYIFAADRDEARNGIL